MFLNTKLLCVHSLAGNGKQQISRNKFQKQQRHPNFEEFYEIEICLPPITFYPFCHVFKLPGGCFKGLLYFKTSGRPRPGQDGFLKI